MNVYKNQRIRSIIHFNIADFAVAVERVIDNRLKDHPLIIAWRNAARAVVYDMSETAYKAGIRKGMFLDRAVRLCRDARVVPPHKNRYESAMHALLKQTLPYSPLIETGEDDGHLFLDVTGTNRISGSPVDLAFRIYRQIRKDLGLSPIWSVAPNKLVAKVATRLVKPIGEYIVGSGEEYSFLAPLPLNLVPGIECEDIIKLRKFNLTRVSELAALGLKHLQVLFDTRAQFIYEVIRGVDTSPVLPVGKKPPKIVIDHEFDNDTNNISALKGMLYFLMEQAGSELRRRRLATGRMGIVFGYSDGFRQHRRIIITPPAANELKFFDLAAYRFISNLPRRIRIRHMRLVCDRLSFPPTQLEIFPDDRSVVEKQANLLSTIDSIRNRFGFNSICSGRTLAA